MKSASGLKTRAYFGSGGVVYGVIGNAHYFTLVVDLRELVCHQAV